jgi:2-succinyl-5-enolpyruvyl-6-hydroxy-3-cyclohexene-1-carboxylate synthase
MESNTMNITTVVKLLKENRIRHIVINPGGTNMAFVKVVQDDPFFKCYSIVDERSAIYFAIGLHLQTGEIIVTSCTSAQATRNYIPGLTEAYYKRVPILAITMEKHPRFVHQEYMQAPNQTSLPEDCVKKSFELPFINDKNDVLHSIRLINDAILELSHNGLGPVQLCIPWLDFPLDDIAPEVRSIKRYYENVHWDDISLENKQILVVIGEHRPFSEYQIKCIEDFCSSTDSAVYVNHLSNYHGKYTIDGNLALSTIQYNLFASTYAPDILITIGGQTGDYPLYKILSRISLTRIEHWRVSDDGDVVDTYDKLTKVFQCRLEEFFLRLASDNDTSHEYFNIWKELQNTKNIDLELPFSNAYAAQQMHDLIPEKSVVQFSILNSLRVWSLFKLNPSVVCYSNVGAFGIDGGMSTLIGQSIETERICLMVIGDLAFYYDMNSLAIRHIKNNVRILLVNNNGGIEFKLNSMNNTSVDRYIAAGNHFKNAEGWAKTCEFKYLSAKSKSEFNELVNVFLGDSDSPILFEIFVSDKDDATAYQRILDVNSQYDFKYFVKKGVKSSLKRLLS